MLEPADAAHAVTLLEAAQQETGKPFSSVPSACNAYLVGLARSNDAALLSKAFQYLAVFRGRFPPDAPRSPSLSARHELICACGRCVRAVTKTLAAQRRLVGPPPAYNQTPQPETATAATAAASDGAQGGEGEDRKESLAAAVSAAAVAGRTGPKPWQVPGPGEDILMFTSLPPSMVSRATVTMFTELAEALWQDYVDHIAWYATPGSANANAIPPAAAPDAAPGAAPPAASADLSEEGAVGDPWPSLAEYLRVTSLLLSDMLYTYNQAGDTRKALDLFNRMRGAPRPVLPNEYATAGDGSVWEGVVNASRVLAGVLILVHCTDPPTFDTPPPPPHAAIVKNLALADKPEEAFTLLEDLERDGACACHAGLGAPLVAGWPGRT